MGCRLAGPALLVLAAAAGCVSLAPRSRAPSPEARVVAGVPLTRFPEDRCGPGSLALVLSAHGTPHPVEELETALAEVPGRGVLSLDMLLAARARGFDAALVAGSPHALRAELSAGRPAILMLRLLDAPGTRRDVFHYVVADGLDPAGGLFRFQFGDGKGRWAPLESLERSWAPAGRALLVAQPSARTDAVLERALALERGGRPLEAAALFEDVLAVRPDSVRAWVDLGNARAAAGLRPEAESAYRRALALSPADRDALNNLAWLLLEEGVRLEEAETLATAASGPGGVDRRAALDTLGRVQLARGRCGQAAATFAAALAAEDVPADARAALEAARERAETCKSP